MSRFIIILLIGINSYALLGQNNTLLNSLKDSIETNAQMMISSKSDAQKFTFSERITKAIIKFTKQEKSMDYNLDSLRLVKVLKSENNRLRIFTWVIPLSDGTFVFKGISQSYVKSNKSYKISILKDKGKNMSRPYIRELTARKWFGAFYYKLIQTKRGKKYFYTLLGWRGIDKTVQSKVVEVITIRSNGDVVFGYNLFKIKGFEYFADSRSVKRLIFKYSTLSNMLLEYDYQTIVLKSKKTHQSKKKKSNNIGFAAQQRALKPKEKMKTIKDNLIVMDRLSPTTQAVKGFHEFYYPESNIIDALRFENNMWKYYPDIDARNKKKPMDDKPKKVEYELVPQ